MNISVDGRSEESERLCNGDDPNSISRSEENMNRAIARVLEVNGAMYRRGPGKFRDILNITTKSRSL